MSDASQTTVPTAAEIDASHEIPPAFAGHLVDLASLQQHVKRAQRQKKDECLDALIRSIDLMIYCQLSILYYMDCSLTKFLVRALPHWFNFTPKPDIISPVPLGQRPFVYTIFGSNTVCMFLHLVFHPPAAGEATRGYLHGGWLVDFVGMKSPVSKWRLLGMDLICLALQLLILSVIMEKQKTTGNVNPIASNGVGQDHDAEEAGLLRSGDITAESIQMQPLRGRSPDPLTGDTLNNSDTASQIARIDDQAETHPLDGFYTGEHMLANLNIEETVRTQWQMSGEANSSAPSSGIQSVASIAGRRFTVTFGTGARARSQP